jgi:hypothetical protein
VYRASPRSDQTSNQSFCHLFETMVILGIERLWWVCSIGVPSIGAGLRKRVLHLPFGA